MVRYYISDVSSKTIPILRIEALLKKYLDKTYNGMVLVEFWDANGFYDYFVGSSILLRNPDGVVKRPQGHHNIKNFWTHEIAVIFDEDWIQTLIHEIIHVNQFHTMTKSHWNQIDLNYPIRAKDPYEIEAIERAYRYAAIEKDEGN